VAEKEVPGLTGEANRPPEPEDDSSPSSVVSEEDSYWRRPKGRRGTGTPDPTEEADRPSETEQEPSFLAEPGPEASAPRRRRPLQLRRNQRNKAELDSTEDDGPPSEAEAEPASVAAAPAAAIAATPAIAAEAEVEEPRGSRSSRLLGRSPLHRRRPRQRRWTYRTLIAAGLLIILSVGAFQLYATLWTRHSQEAGRALVHQFLKNRSLNSPVSGTSGPGGTASLASCRASQQGKDPVKGLLEIPKLNVTAPVEEGIADTQLDVAVGHDPASVWPGAVGNSVLEAHDVTYFVGLSKLNTGDSVLFVAPCTTTVFQVTDHAVVNEGAPVYDTSTPTITLVTCWPTNALWFTPQRYLVFARLVRQSSTGGGGQQYVATSKPPTVPVPAELASQGVTLTTYSLPMGTFTLAGTPDQAWAQTTNPLLVENAGVEAYIAGVRSLVEDHLDWWNAVAPGVSAPGPLVGANNPSYLSSLDVTITAAGTQVTSVTLTNTIGVSGGKAPGHYAVTVTETVKNGALTISSWTLQPA
jgi:sortase A